jgi:choline kinase
MRLLAAVGVDDIVVAAGFRAERVQAELARLGASKVRVVINPDYRDGSVVTLWSLREEIARAPGALILMDGDVLYDRRMLERLIASKHTNCFLLDRAVEPGEEPMKLAIKDGQPVDFRKTLERPHDFYGESVGFFRLSGACAGQLVQAAEQLIASGARHEYFEEALRAVLLAAPPGRFGFEDVTGLPWIEIDFPADIERAECEILPRLLAEDR